MTINYSLKEKYRYLIFDFDGTLNNTAPGIVATFQKTLDLYWVDYTGVDFNRHIGPPLEYSFKELVGGDNWQEALETYRDIFSRDNAVMNSFLYDHIVDTLEILCGEGFEMSVATSKYEPFAVESLEKLGIAHFFSYVYGQVGERGFKNEILNALICDNGWDKADCLMIGDTCYDVEGARDNDVDILAVTYGFGRKDELEASLPDALADSPAEIAELLAGRSKRQRHS